MMFLKLLDHPVDRLVDRGIDLVIFTAGFERMGLNIHDKIDLMQPPFFCNRQVRINDWRVELLEPCQFSICVCSRAI
jgi:hypothetical protein